MVCNGKRVSDIDLTIDDLNPRLNAELEEMRKNIEEVEITIVHPEAKEEPKHQRELGEYPDMEEMNKHDKVHDVTEWNSSLHLLLNFCSKVSCLCMFIWNVNSICHIIDVNRVFFS